MNRQTLAPALTPHGRLMLVASDDAPELEPALATRLLGSFERGSGHALLQLGAGEVGSALPPVLSYWRELGARFVTAVCALPDVEELRAKAPVPDLAAQELEALALAAPPMIGAEYLTAAVVQGLKRL